jgi:hypothetical protein
MTGDVPLEMSKANPRLLIIGEQNMLRLFVDGVGSIYTGQGTG